MKMKEIHQLSPFIQHSKLANHRTFKLYRSTPEGPSLAPGVLWEHQVA